MKVSTSKKELREFGILIGFGIPFFIGWLIPKALGHGFREWTLWIGLSALILALIGPKLLKYPYKWWMALGHVLGWFNSHIILGIVFIIVLQPIALIMRLAGHDPLRKPQKEVKSYRENKQGNKIYLNRIF